ncbi:hypothetical protein C8J56DRAFT_396404 [Mycena floridula]|nr:hypothetical protein C8J56DRAFT_396404 [Mycena floridula]
MSSLYPPTAPASPAGSAHRAMDQDHVQFGSADLHLGASQSLQQVASNQSLPNQQVPSQVASTSNQQLQPLRPPKLHLIDLEIMHTNLYKSRYLVPQEFLDDVGGILSNAEMAHRFVVARAIREENDERRLHEDQRKRQEELRMETQQAEDVDQGWYRDRERDLREREKDENRAREQRHRERQQEVNASLERWQKAQALFNAAEVLLIDLFDAATKGELERMRGREIERRRERMRLKEEKIKAANGVNPSANTGFNGINGNSGKFSGYFVFFSLSLSVNFIIYLVSFWSYFAFFLALEEP